MLVYDFENKQVPFTKANFRKVLDVCASSCEMFSLTVGWAYDAKETLCNYLHRICAGKSKQRDGSPITPRGSIR